MLDREIAEMFNCSRNRVCSLRFEYGIKRLYSHERKRLPEPTDEQFQILYGSLLGDGCLTRSYTDREYHYEELHCIAQSDYLEWKANKLKSLGSFFTKRTKGTNGNSVTEMRLPPQPIFTELYGDFYKGGTRNLPIGLLAQFNEKSLAVWYMDDGSFSRPNGTICTSIASNAYSEGENKILRNWLFDKFEIEMTIGEKKILYNGEVRVYHGLYAYGRKARNFLELVSPHTHLSMRYKLGEVV